MADTTTGQGTLDRTRLGIYLNDHLAGASAGRSLARRSLARNRGTEYGRTLERLVREIDEDHATLRDLMRRLGIPERPYKQAATLLAERAGRLKLNGQLRGYSPLSRFVELEALLMGIEGKRSMWRALAVVAQDEPALRDVDFDLLAVRAEDQKALLEAQRREVVAEALGSAAGAAR
jgi:hypothetical protein